MAQRNFMIKAREAKRMSQQAVADLVQVAQSSIAQYETGDRTPRPPLAKKIAALVGFDWKLFYDETAS